MCRACDARCCHGEQGGAGCLFVCACRWWQRQHRGSRCPKGCRGAPWSWSEWQRGWRRWGWGPLHFPLTLIPAPMPAQPCGNCFAFSMPWRDPAVRSDCAPAVSMTPPRVSPNQRYECVQATTSKSLRSRLRCCSHLTPPSRRLQPVHVVKLARTAMPASMSSFIGAPCCPSGPPLFALAPDPKPALAARRGPIGVPVACQTDPSAPARSTDQPERAHSPPPQRLTLCVAVATVLVRPSHGQHGTVRHALGGAATTVRAGVPAALRLVGESNTEKQGAGKPRKSK